MKNGKKIVIVSSLLTGILIVLLPFLVIISTIATPVQFIVDIWNSIWRDDSVSLEFISAVDNYMSTEEGVYEVQQYYIPAINKAKKDYDVDIPIHHLILPNLISGITAFEEKEKTPKDISKYINAMINEYINQTIKIELDQDRNKVEKIEYSLTEPGQYIVRLKQTFPWQDTLKKYSSEKILNLLIAFDNFSFIKQDNAISINPNGNQNYIYVPGEFPPYASGLKTLPDNRFGDELMAQCTWYVANRYLEFGINIFNYGLGHWGNGGDWWQQAMVGGMEISKTPQAGWAISMPPRSPGTVIEGYYSYAGHVAFVEEVHDGYIIISEMNAGILDSYRVYSIPESMYQHHWFINFGLKK